MTVTIRLARLPHSEGLPLPAYETPGSAGMDLRAAVADDQPLTLPPGGRALVPTGLMIALPPHHEAQVRPRSGLALKFGITCLNSPGTIDADYRGEVGVILANLGPNPSSSGAATASPRWSSPPSRVASLKRSRAWTRQHGGPGGSARREPDSAVCVTVRPGQA